MKLARWGGRGRRVSGEGGFVGTNGPGCAAGTGESEMAVRGRVSRVLV